MKKLIYVVIALLILGLIATLPFHYIIPSGERGSANPNVFKVIAKENLTFKNTFVTPEVVDQELRRFNSASWSVQHKIRNEVLFNELVENDLIELTKGEE